MASDQIYKISFQEPLDDRLAFLLLDTQRLKKTTTEDCDLVIHNELLWNDKSTKKKLKSISSEFSLSGKKIVIFIVSDYEYTYKVPSNLILFRTSLRNSKRLKNEHIFPYIWVLTKASFPVNESMNQPQVGFCGKLGKHRKKLTKTFEKSDLVDSKFIIRKKFWGGSPGDIGLTDAFEKNISDSQYVLCNRGSGNFSMRFYQVLSFGRIPVLVNTDLLLPFEDQIPWRECVIVENSESACLEKVIETHKSGECISMQKRCRKIYEDFLHPDKVGFLLLKELFDT